MRLTRVALSLVALAAGCVGLSQNDRTRLPPSGERAPDVAPPRLVVVAIFDQLGASSLARLLPLLDDDGAIRTAMANGAEHRVAHAYSATYTAPGHARAGVAGIRRRPGAHGPSAWPAAPAARGAHARRRVDQRRPWRRTHAGELGQGRTLGTAGSRGDARAEAGRAAI